VAAVEEAPQGKTGPSLVVQLGVLLVLTAMAVGIGWFSGRYLNDSRAPAPPEETKAARILSHGEKGKDGKDAKDAKDGKDADAEAEGGVVPIPAITTNLDVPSSVWVRLELSLVFDGPVDHMIANDIQQDILAYMRTVKLVQIEGPSGFQHLKQDLNERAAIRSKGRVKQILVRTLLFE
jgi:flagellar FliL protein